VQHGRAADAEVPASPLPRPAVSPAPVPSELVAGLEAFLDRDYPAAIALLGRVAGGTPRAGAFALLLRAAAEQALYLLGSGDDAIARIVLDEIFERRRQLAVIFDNQDLQHRQVSPHLTRIILVP